MRSAARKAGEGDVAYSDRCSKETAMVAEFDDLVENLTAIQALAEMQRMPILYAGDYNSDLRAGVPWWTTKVLQNGWGSMMEPAAGSLQHTYRSPQAVGRDSDGGTSRIDGFCVPEAIAPSLRNPEMQIAEPTDNAYYDHVPIRCELLMGNIQPIRQMRDQFRYPTKYLDVNAISPELHEAITRAFVSVLASAENTHEDMFTRIGELAQLIERPACEQRRRRDPPDRDRRQLRQLLSQAIRAGAREIVPLIRKLIQQHDRHRAAERLANLKKRNIDKLATAPAEIYAMIRGEYKENPTVSALQHSSGHMVTGKASVEEILMDKWRSEVFNLPPSAATPEFRETFLQSPPKQAKNTAKLMADVTADEVRDVAHALNSKAAVIGLPLHFFTQNRDDIREAMAKRCTRLLREGAESLRRFELVMLLKEAGVCTDPLKLRPIALSTAVYRFFAKILERRLRASLGLLQPGDPDATMSSAQAGSCPGMAVDDVLAVFGLAWERAAVRDAPPLCILILDWAKYYDRIPAWLVAEVFLAHGIPPGITHIVTSLFSQRRMAFRTSYGVSAEFNPRNGVSQGCPLAGLAAVLVQDSFGRALDRMIEGVQLAELSTRGHRVIQEAEEVAQLAFVDDTTMLTPHEPRVRDGIYIGSHELPRIEAKIELWCQCTGAKRMRTKLRG